MCVLMSLAVRAYDDYFNFSAQKPFFICNTRRFCAVIRFIMEKCTKTHLSDWKKFNWKFKFNENFSHAFHHTLIKKINCANINFLQYLFSIIFHHPASSSLNLSLSADHTMCMFTAYEMRAEISIKNFDD